MRSNSAQEHIDEIDVLLPEWFAVDPDQERVTRLTAAHTKELQLFIDFNRETKPAARRSIVGNGRSLECVARQWRETKRHRDIRIQIVTQGSFDGLCFDVTGAPQTTSATSLNL